VIWIMGPPRTARPCERSGGLAFGAASGAGRVPAPRAALRRNDSGITHLAAASGCATIALFGASDSAVWAPRGPYVTIVEHTEGGLEAIAVDEIFRKLLREESLR